MTTRIEVTQDDIDAAIPTGVERHDITSHEQWLDLRSRDMTASVIGSVVGVHDYTTALEQWAIRTGRAFGPEPTEDMQRGADLEPVAVVRLRRAHPDWTIHYPLGLYLRDPAARIGATLDVVAIDPRRPGIGNVQVKTSKWRPFQKWLQPGGLEPPLWIALQAMTEAKLVGASWAIVWVMVDFELKCYEVDVPIDDGAWDALREAVARFWTSVATDLPPEPVYGRDGAVLALLDPRPDNGTSVDLGAHNDLPEMLERDEQLRAVIKEAAAGRDAIHDQVVERLAGATYGHLADWIVTNKTVATKAYTVAARETQVLRITRKKQRLPGR
jgi:hypothetical protein